MDFVNSRRATSNSYSKPASTSSTKSTEEITPQLETDYIANEYFELCKLEAITLPLDTSTKFNAQREDHELSPIDLFLTNTTELNKLIGSNYSPILGNLLLLGYVSAAESYIRALIRRLINCDEYISSLVSEKTVSFAAALHHKKEILPEALLEEFSLASPYNVFETLKDLIGMKGHRPASLIPPSEEFKKVCELRHCCVHRFGKLGSKNAIRLGMIEHIEHLEKPILLSQSDIESIAFIVENFVRSINNYVYKFILERSAKNKNDADGGRPFYETEWTWDFTNDKDRFNNYYNIFFTSVDLVKSMPSELSYKKFSDEFKPKPQSLPKRKKKSEPNEIDQSNNVPA
jgi:hypothetical protein